MGSRRTGVEKTRIDNALKDSHNTVFGEQLTATKLTTAMTNAVYGKGVMKIIETTANGGTITTDDSMLICSTSTATDGLASAESEHAVRYRPGEEFYALFTVVFSAGVVGSIQLSGPCSPTDGFSVGMNGTNFCVMRRSDGTDNLVNQGNFNRDNLDGTGASGYVINVTNLNLFRITFGWLGSANIFFQTFSNRQGWITFHEIETAGTLSQPHILVPYLPMTISATKTSGDTDVVIKSGSWNGGIMGQPTVGVSDRLHAADSGIISVLAATETVLLTVRSLATLNSVVNRIQSILLHWSVVSDGTKPVVYRLYKNATIVGGAFSDVETDVSIMEQNTTNTITGGTFLLGTSTPKEGSKDIDTEHLRINTHKNDSWTITAESANLFDASTAITWREEF